MSQNRKNVATPEVFRCLRGFFDELYDVYTRREYVPPDPVEALYVYDDPRDREIAGLVASCLAYGRAASISKSVAKILGPLSLYPREALLSLGKGDLCRLYSGFRHRFTSGDAMAALLSGATNVVREFGTLGACFRSMFGESGELEGAAGAFVREIRRAGGLEDAFLLPDPADGSACKRLFLYVKWMVRRDAVDPGGWDDIPAYSLMMPVDTHIFHIGRELGFTTRSQADLRTCREITNAFAKISPEDPTKYDFCLSRFGIRSDLEIGDLLAGCAALTGPR